MAIRKTAEINSAARRSAERDGSPGVKDRNVLNGRAFPL